MRVCEVLATPSNPTLSHRVDSVDHPEDQGDPEWDNGPHPNPRPRYGVDISRGQWLLKKKQALQFEDLTLMRRLEPFTNFETDDNNVIIAAFPDPNDANYDLEQGVPEVVQQNPGRYVEIEIPGSWFHEDMRTTSVGDEGPDFEDAHEICYIRKDFKYREYVERLVNRHNQIEKLIKQSWKW